MFFICPYLDIDVKSCISPIRRATKVFAKSLFNVSQASGYTFDSVLANLFKYTVDKNDVGVAPYMTILNW